MELDRQCQPLVVTIDGPAGSGKSTVAKGAAAQTGFRYLDTGKLYRAITLYLSEMGIPPVENESLIAALGNLELKLEGGRVLITGEDVTEKLHTPKVDGIVSLYSALPKVRERLLFLQRAQAGPPGLIADGRDMGSVVFPEAALKIFLLPMPGNELKEGSLSSPREEKEWSSNRCCPLLWQGTGQIRPEHSLPW